MVHRGELSTATHESPPKDRATALTTRAAISHRHPPTIPTPTRRQTPSSLLSPVSPPTSTSHVRSLDQAPLGPCASRLHQPGCPTCPGQHLDLISRASAAAFCRPAFRKAGVFVLGLPLALARFREADFWILPSNFATVAADGVWGVVWMRPAGAVLRAARV